MINIAFYNKEKEINEVNVLLKCMGLKFILEIKKSSQTLNGISILFELILRLI
jgi:hypothetical protein